MSNSELQSLITETLKFNITLVVINDKERISLIGLGIDPLVRLIEMMGFQNNTEYLDTNGCNMDFGYDFEKNGEKYYLWGSLTSGSFMFEKQKIKGGNSE